MPERYWHDGFYYAGGLAVGLWTTGEPILWACVAWAVATPLAAGVFCGSRWLEGRLRDGCAAYLGREK